MELGRTGARFPKTLDGVVEASVAGPLRRWEETVDAVDLVASSNDPEALVEQFLRSPLILSSQMDGPNSCVAQFADGAMVSLTAVPPKEFAVTLLVKTGSSSSETATRSCRAKEIKFALAASHGGADLQTARDDLHPTGTS